MPKNFDAQILGVKIGTYDGYYNVEFESIGFTKFNPNNYIKRTYLNNIDYDNLVLEFDILCNWGRLYVNQDSKGIDQKVIDIDMYDVITQTYNILKNYGEKCL